MMSNDNIEVVRLILIVFSMLVIKYVRKSEAPFFLRLNNREEDVKNPNGIDACNYSSNQNHVFREHGELTLIKK